MSSRKWLEESIDKQRREIDVSGAMFRTRIFRVWELMNMLDTGKLKLIGGKPFKKWLRSHKSRAIESLLLGLPPGSIIIDGADSPWFIADGAELISAIYEFVKDNFGLEYLNFKATEYADSRFSQLPLMLQSRIMNLEIIATVINPDTFDIYRLGIYNTSLLKIGKEKKLWNCAEAVYPVPFNKVHDTARELGVADPRKLWLIMTAMFFDERFKTGKLNNNLNIGEIRFDMFECILLERFDAIKTCLATSQAASYQTIGLIAELAEKAFEDGRILWTEKKRTVFIIVLSLMSKTLGQHDLKRILQNFKTAWKNHIGTGTGNLYEDYAKKSSAIYNYMIR